MQKGVSLPILQSTDVLVVSFLTSLSPVGWIAGGLFPNTVKSKEKESSLFPSINQLSINEWIYRRSQVLLEIFLLQENTVIFAISTFARSPCGKNIIDFNRVIVFLQNLKINL